MLSDAKVTKKRCDKNLMWILDEKNVTKKHVPHVCVRQK